MNKSLSVFLDNLIDYAGLFPPAKLPLNLAIEQYAKYVSSEDAWMLGPFVVPIAQLDALEAHTALFSEAKVLSLSIITSRCESEQSFSRQFQQDKEKIGAFDKKFSEGVRINMLEVSLPPAVPSAELLQELSQGAEVLNVRAFCEVSFLNDWQAHVLETLDCIAEHNATVNTKIGIKLRTGGITADLFPSPEQVAFMLAACRDRQLPMKFTAGLHHPVRMFRAEVQTKMHGFLNIFLAGMLAYTNKLENHQIEEILLDEQANHFTFTDGCLAWKEYRLRADEIESLREQALLSFGSCSFDEPREELMLLKNQQEALL